MRANCPRDASDVVGEDNRRREVLPESQNPKLPDAKHKTQSSSLLPHSGPAGFDNEHSLMTGMDLCFLLFQIGVCATVIMLLLHGRLSGETEPENYGPNRNTILIS